MIDHDEMLIEFRYASADHQMRDACYKDRKKFFVKGAWWDGSHGKQFANKPKPEFNRIWRSMNRLIGTINDMELNAIIVPSSEEADEEGAELLQNIWRNHYQSSDGAQASEIATMEAVIGGFGAVKEVVVYEDEENPNPDMQTTKTVACRDACQSVYFDAGAVEQDKSDATRGWHLVRCNRRKKEKEFGTSITSFMNPTSAVHRTEFDYNTQRDIYLAHFYEVIEKTVKDHDFSLLNGVKITSGDGIKDDMGNKYTRSDLEEMKQIYLEEVGEKVPTIERKIKYVECAIADGEKYLTKPQRVPFKRVPLYPRYGYYTVLQGQEYYCGEVRRQEDHEMFHNYFGSTMMEIMAAPQISKPEYTPGQIQRFANERARADIDNVPYVLSDPILDANKNPVHFGPIGMTQPPQIGTGLAAAGQFLEGSISEINGMGQASVPSNASGEAIQNVNERQDDSFLPIVKNVVHAISAQCEGFIPVALALNFTNSRRIRIQSKDGSYSQVTTMEMTTDANGNVGPYGNNPRGKYTVQVKQGEAYKDTVTAKIQSNMELMAVVGSDTVAGQIIAYENMKLLNKDSNPMIDSISKYAPLDLILQSGFPYEPQDEEEAQYIQMRIKMMRQQAQSQQDPAMIVAQAESQARINESEAALINEQNDAVKNQIEKFKAETGRMDVITKAKKAGADINLKQDELQLKTMGAMNKAFMQ